MQLNSITMAVAAAGLNRADFPCNINRVATNRVKWPRKRHNGSTGIQRDVMTGKKVGKV